MSGPRPNVLLITGDHVRPDILDATADRRANSRPLCDVLKMPHLDALAQQGIAFNHCYTPNPICVPARAAITTGRYPHRATGIKNNGGQVSPDLPTLAGHFAANGYRTTAIGKLHYLPYSAPGSPRLLNGFQHAELCEEGRILNQYDPQGRLRGLEDYHDWLADRGWPGYERSHAVGNNDVHPTSVPFPADLHEEAWVAARCTEHLRRQAAQRADEPWLMWASFTKPHPPYDPPAPYDRMYDPRDVPPPQGVDEPARTAVRDRLLGRTRTQYGWDLLAPEAVQTIRAAYCGLMSFQDAMIGRILATLRDTGQLDNTIVIYTADHGDLLGDFGCFFKCSMLDASVRVPLVIHAPGCTETGSPRREHLASLVDLFPTLCELTGLDAPAGMDGVSLAPILRDPSARGAEYVVSQCLDAPHQKYLVRTPRYKYVYTQVEATEELYDAEATDHELVNLAGDPQHAEALRTLRGRLIAWCRERGDAAMLDGDDLARSSADTLGSAKIQPHLFGWRPY